MDIKSINPIPYQQEKSNFYMGLKQEEQSKPKAIDSFPQPHQIVTHSLSNIKHTKKGF